MILAARDLHVTLGERRLLAGIDLELQPGAVTLLVGRNGSGKSTLLATMAGLRAADRGQVMLDGHEVGAMRPRDRARQITVIPQDTDSPFEFTGRELVMMGRHPHIPRFSVPGPEDRAAVERALELADAMSYADRAVTTLSGGERQRIAIARALATGARVLLADEPTANLDLDHALAALHLFRRLASEGHTVLLVSHDVNLTAPAADRVAVLHDGRIRSHDTAEAALSPETMREVFGVISVAPAGYFPRAFCKD